MKRTLLATSLAATIATFSLNAQAESPFNYIKYTMGSVSADGADDGDYSAFSASLEVPIVPILSLELIDFNETDITRLGVGNAFDFGVGHAYGFVHYNDYEGDLDSDLSLTAGFHTYITERLDLDVSFSTYTEQDAQDGTKFSLGYYLTNNVSFAVNYQDLELSSVTSLSAKLGF